MLRHKLRRFRYLSWSKKTLIILLLLLLFFFFLHLPYFFAQAQSALIAQRVTSDVPSSAAAPVPVLLLHGFNPTYSPRVAEFSLESLQHRLSSDLGYLDKGLLLPTTTCAELYSAQQPILVRVSYLTGLREPTIDAYAQHLARAVAQLKTCTGASHVDIVTHSMGGIVVRYYLAFLDASSVRRVIMLATPNHGGVYGFANLTRTLVALTPVELDFLSLAEDSIFMTSLAAQERPVSVAFFTLAGLVDDRGDGVVLADSVAVFNSTHAVVACDHFSLKSPRLCPLALPFIEHALSS